MHLLHQDFKCLEFSLPNNFSYFLTVFSATIALVFFPNDPPSKLTQVSYMCIQSRNNLFAIFSACSCHHCYSLPQKTIPIGSHPQTPENLQCLFLN